MILLRKSKPHPLEKLLEKGYTGNKGPGGFYENKAVDGNRLKALNTSDMSYYDFDKVDLPIARRVERKQSIADDDSEYGKYVFMSKIINYSAFVSQVSFSSIDVPFVWVSIGMKDL